MISARSESLFLEGSEGKQVELQGEFVPDDFTRSDFPKISSAFEHNGIPTRKSGINSSDTSKGLILAIKDQTTENAQSNQGTESTGSGKLFSYRPKGCQANEQFAFSRIVFFDEETPIFRHVDYA